MARLSWLPFGFLLVLTVFSFAIQTAGGEGSLRLQDCPNACNVRCSQTSHKSACLEFCNYCCQRINVIDIAPPAAEIELLTYRLKAKEQEIELFKYRSITEEQAIQIVILQQQIQGYQQKEKEKAVITTKLEEQNLLLSERISALEAELTYLTADFRLKMEETQAKWLEIQVECNYLRAVVLELQAEDEKGERN
ncbi:hypothetical protein V6N13_091635 [Hibiscus sabdariffa]|uniref:Uncharacterized protein n=1 Tax=Hibiscus sabdariffa TaxID=183260 RepID=A0ABR2QEJ5_9ROSI